MIAVSKVRRTKPYDYYSSEGDSGEYMGRGAAARGLLGKRVTKEAFEGFLLGLDGETKIVRNGGSEWRFWGWDVVGSPPRSCDIWPLLHPETEPDFLAARDAGGEALVGFCEEKLELRRGAQGKRREKGRGLLCIRFRHWLSRALQRNGHDHYVFPNLALAYDGSWLSIPGIASTKSQRDGGNGSAQRNLFYQFKIEAGRVYRDAVRAELERRGYRTRERQGFGWELKGVSDSLIEHFSARRKEVLAKFKELREEHGESIPDQKLLQWAARSSRSTKPQNIDIDELREVWRQEAKLLQELHEHSRTIERIT